MKQNKMHDAMRRMTTLAAAMIMMITAVNPVSAAASTANTGYGSIRISTTSNTGYGSIRTSTASNTGYGSIRTSTTSNTGYGSIRTASTSNTGYGSIQVTSASDTGNGSIQVIGEIPVWKVTLSRTSVTLTEGSSTKITASIYPASATNDITIWSTSNYSVASVSAQGVITAKKAGTATVTFRTENGKKATCRVTVKAKAGSTGSYLNVSEAYTLLNRFRTTRSNQWYWNPRNTKKITTYGLKSLKRNAALENVAKLRAKEQWEQYYLRGRKTHDRPNGQLCWTAYPKNVKPEGENLAWGQTTCKEVILDGNYGWAETYKKYSGQGHRRSMLSSKSTKVGIACYTKNGKTCWAMCLGA